MQRRRFLSLAQLAALAPLATSRGALASDPGMLIAPPAGPMAFGRVLTRELAGGARITVAREYSIRFLRFADGFEVTGEQVSADVTAPASLAAFAELERNRLELGLFPLTLDPFGTIVSTDLAVPPSVQVDHAYAVAMDLVGRQALDAASRDELRQHLTAIHQTGAILMAQIPSDLFAPADRERFHRQTLPLAGAMVGEVETRFRSERDPQSGLLRLAEREVLTRIEADQRRTHELWHLRADG